MSCGRMRATSVLCCALRVLLCRFCDDAHVCVHLDRARGRTEPSQRRLVGSRLGRSLYCCSVRVSASVREQQMSKVQARITSMKSGERCNVIEEKRSTIDVMWMGRPAAWT